MKGVSFPDPGVAKAAFALGPVRYRCWVCGKTHTSGSDQASRCLGRLARGANWRVFAGPLPARPHLTPALTFARTEWRNCTFSRWPGERELWVPEYLLAVDGLSPRIRKWVRKELASALERCSADLDRLWDFRERFCRWVSALSEKRPPGVVVGVETHPAQVSRISAGIGIYTVRPALPAPSGVPGIPVLGAYLWRVVVRCGRLKKWWYAGELVHVAYGEDAFVAVFERQPHAGARYVVCREEYGQRPRVIQVGLPGIGPEEALRVALAGGRRGRVAEGGDLQQRG